MPHGRLTAAPAAGRRSLPAQTLGLAGVAGATAVVGRTERRLASVPPTTLRPAELTSVFNPARFSSKQRPLWSPAAIALMTQAPDWLFVFLPDSFSLFASAFLFPPASSPTHRFCLSCCLLEDKFSRNRKFGIR